MTNEEKIEEIEKILNDFLEIGWRDKSQDFLVMEIEKILFILQKTNIMETPTKKDEKNNSKYKNLEHLSVNILKEILEKETLIKKINFLLMKRDI